MNARDDRLHLPLVPVINLRNIRIGPWVVILLVVSLLPACSGDPDGPETRVRALVAEAESLVEAGRLRPLAGLLAGLLGLAVSAAPPGTLGGWRLEIAQKSEIVTRVLVSGFGTQDLFVSCHGFLALTQPRKGVAAVV